jgi:uncharacterized ion transporter superfamily protein YfcC
VDTFILVIAGIFTVVMFIMLPKYARFINNQPKEHMKRMQEQEEAEKSAKSGDEKNQD